MFGFGADQMTLKLLIIYQFHFMGGVVTPVFVPWFGNMFGTSMSYVK